MQLWLVLSASVALLLLIAVFSRVELELDLRAQGNPDGTWLAAFGAAMGPVAAAAIVAHGVPLRLDVYLVGRRVPILPRKRARVKSASKPASQESRENGSERLARWFRKGKPMAEKHAGFALSLGRYVAVESLVVQATYGFKDVALTGRIVATMAVLSPVLPRAVRLVHTPLWEGEERWEVSGQGKIGLWPGRVLLEVLWYMLALRWPKRTSPKSLEAS